jgi:ABC-2 type transport system ATP-binding protein
MIRAEKLSKYYGGKRALGPVSFEIREGESVGFLGLNGAGKTTALRILACDLRPSGGRVAIGDVDAVARPQNLKTRIGFLPEHPPLYSDMTVADYLAFAGRLRGVEPGEIRRQVDRAASITQVADVKNELIRHLSHGYRQRVGVAQAVIHEPSLLILDEPTRGLDPVQIVEMRTMLRDLKAEHTVLISSHILTEISETCDRLLVLGQGEIIASGSETELSAGLLESTQIRVGVALPDEAAPADAKLCIEGVEDVTSVAEPDLEDGAHIFEVTSSKDARAEIVRALVRAGFDVVHLDRSRRELEQIFLELVRGKGGADAVH